LKRSLPNEPRNRLAGFDAATRSIIREGQRINAGRTVPVSPCSEAMREEPAPENGSERQAGESLDQAGIEAMFHSEALRLRRYFRVRIGQPDEAADLVQETFLRMVGSQRDRAIENPLAYLHRIARNLLFDRTRRLKARGPVRELPLDLGPEIAVPASQSYDMEAAQLMESYQRALDALPPRTREVFLLHRIDGFSYMEIASQLGISARTVEWHITEAIFRIRRKLDEE
jgi:RNA polymerase sigma factor (sigma-70 family)